MQATVNESSKGSESKETSGVSKGKPKILKTPGVSATKDSDRNEDQILSTQQDSQLPNGTTPALKGMDADLGNWTLVAKFRSDNSQIAQTMLSLAELQSGLGVGSPSNEKYLLPLSSQNFKMWNARVNGTWMSPVSYSIPQNLHSFGAKTPSIWPAETALTIGSSKGKGILFFQRRHSDSWVSSESGDVMLFGIASMSYSNGGDVPPFKTVIPNAADNNFCYFSGGGISGTTAAPGFGCRTEFLKYAPRNEVEAVEVWGRAEPLASLLDEGSAIINPTPTPTPTVGLTSTSYLSLMENDASNWVLVARFEGDNGNISENMLSVSELQSGNQVGNSQSGKYLLPLAQQSFKMWNTKVNGVWMKPVKYDQAQNLQSWGVKTPSIWSSESAVILGESPEQGIFFFQRRKSDSWVTSASGDAMYFGIATTSYMKGGSVYPFVTAVPNAADNNFCYFSGGGISGNTAAAGFGCRTAFLQYSTVNQKETIEVWGRAEPLPGF